MKKLYVSPDAEYLKIEFIYDVLTASNPNDTQPDTIGKGEVDLDLGGHSGDAMTTFY